MKTRRLNAASIALAPLAVTQTSSRPITTVSNGVTADAFSQATKMAADVSHISMLRLVVSRPITS